MDIYHTIIRPLVTEKTTRAVQRSTEEHGGTYSFVVRGDANKAEIRDAVEKIYGVHVVSVRTAVRAGKPRRSRLKMTLTPPTKRAMVTVEKDQHIDLF